LFSPGKEYPQEYLKVTSRRPRGMTAWKPSLSRDDDAKTKKAFKREEDAHFNSKRGGNERDFVVKDDAQYFEDLLFGEECTDGGGGKTAAGAAEAKGTSSSRRKV
jgi:hypothetical protein